MPLMSDGGPDIQKFQLRQRVVTTGEPIEINGRTYRLRRDLRPKLSRTISLMQSRAAASQNVVRTCAERIDELSTLAEAAPIDEKEAIYVEQLAELDKVDVAETNTRRWLIATLELFIDDMDDALRTDLQSVENVGDVMAIVNHVMTTLGFASAATDAEVEGLDPTEPKSPKPSPTRRRSARSSASTASN
jgi:hypothetical protein